MIPQQSYWSSVNIKEEDGEEFNNKEDDRNKRRHKKVKKDKKEKRQKRTTRSYSSDHEEVNEIQDGFEIDSVGKVENSDLTLQKMKSAIIGILDEEIFSLGNK